MESLFVFSMVVLFIVVLCWMVLLPSYIITQGTQWYANLTMKREVKNIIASYKPERLAKKRQFLQQKLKQLPIVNLHIESVEDAVEILQINCNVQEIVFEESTINHEMNFVSAWGNKDMLEVFHRSIQEYVMPIRMVYTSPIGGIDATEDIMQFFKNRYPQSSMFTLAQHISPVFIDKLLSKEIVLLGMCAFGHPYQKHIPVLLIAFEKEHHDSRTQQPLPLYPEQLMKWPKPRFLLGFFIIFEQYEHLYKKSAIFSCIF